MTKKLAIEKVSNGGVKADLLKVVTFHTGEDLDGLLRPHNASGLIDDFLRVSWFPKH
jgi:hypothetical protein